MQGGLFGALTGAFLGRSRVVAAHPVFVQSPAEAAEVLLEEVRSPFAHIVVGQRGTVRTLYFVVDGERVVESRLDERYPTSLDLDYSRTMMAGFLVHPKARSLLMVGLGGGQITNYLFARRPGIEIDAVDLDPEVVRLAKRHFRVPSDDRRYRTHVADGRAFVENARRTWDMIMLDAFRGLNVPRHLKTKECYEACARALGPDGVLVVNLHDHSPEHARDRQTLKAVFPDGYAFRSEAGNQTTFVARKGPVAGQGRPARGTFELFAHAAELSPQFDFDLQGLAARYTRRGTWDRAAEIFRDPAVSRVP